MKGFPSDGSSPRKISVEPREPQSLAASRLSQSFTRQLDRSRFGYVDFLRELAIHARDTRLEATPSKALLAYTLERFLYQWADELDIAPPPPISKVDRLRARFFEPVWDAIACLADTKRRDASTCAIKLVAAIPFDEI